MKRSQLMKILALALAISMTFAVAACGTSSAANSTTAVEATSGSSAEETTSSSSAADTSVTIDVEIPYQAPPGDAAEFLDGTSQEVRDNFSQLTDEVNKSVYADFEAVDGPWKVYFIDMMQANSWLAGVKNTIVQDCEKYQAAGLISDFVTQDPNGNVTTQIQQIQTAVEQGANLIITVPLSSNALNAAIEQAYNAGCVVVTIGGIVTSPYAINIDKNNSLMGAMLAAGLVKALNGTGNVLMVDGVAGGAMNDNMHNGGMLVFDKNPGIKVAGSVNGDWSPSVAKTAVLQYLATHPGKIDAIWQQGSMFLASYQALEQAGRPIVPVTDSNPTQAGTAIAVEGMESGWQTAYTGIPPQPIADAAFAIGIQTLLGNGPQVNTIVCKPVMIDNSNVKDWYKAEYSNTSDAVADPPADVQMFPKSMLDELFSKEVTFPEDTLYYSK